MARAPRADRAREGRLRAAGARRRDPLRRSLSLGLLTSVSVALASGCGSESSDYVEPVWLPTGGSGGAGTTTSSTSSTTTSATGSGGQGGEAGGPNVGGGGAAGGCELGDVTEPSDTEETAHHLTIDPIGDCDGNGDQVSAAITDVSDVDWFVYRGNDTLTCSVDPTAMVVGGAGLELCQFAECLSADTTVDECPGGTSPAISPAGRAGCCGTGGFTIDFNCEGSLDEDGYVYIRVSVPDAEPGVCNGYVLSYHF